MTTTAQRAAELDAAAFDPDDVEPWPLWAVELHLRQVESAEALARIEATMSTVLELADRIKAEVTPFLDSISRSPLVKMLGVKK